MASARGRDATGWTAALLLAAQAGALAWAAPLHAPAIDEVGHLAAGLSHWQTGRFDLYCVNPPLARLVAALPVLALHPRTDWQWLDAGPAVRPEFHTGRALLEANGPPSLDYFARARRACLVFALLGGFVCYRWARELYGPRAGLLAVALWCVCPNILGNAQLITPDLAATATGLAAAYAFWRWLALPTRGRTLVAGLALGLAELARSSWVFLFFLWPALWLAWRWPERATLGRRGWGRQTAQLVLIGLAGLYLLNLGYGFEGTGRPLGRFQFLSAALAGPPPAGSTRPNGNRFAGTVWAGLPVPVPAAYLQGIDAQKRDFERTMHSYLRGEWRQGGWWYYYLYGLLVKVPLGTWCLVLLACDTRSPARTGPTGCRAPLVLLGPPLVLLTLVSSQTGFSHHVRYVLPVLPFAFVWLSRLAADGIPASGFRRALVGGALACSAVSSLSIFPHSLSYFNEAAGGPERGGDHLVDSNLDWGQDLLYLKRWYDEHPEARPLGLAYFGYFDPRLAGIEFAPPPPEPRPGWYAVSVTILRGAGPNIPDGQGGWVGTNHDAYGYFRRFRPVGRAGYSIYVYHLTPDEAGGPGP